jgi:GH25 family lysozyme M1 (1,4-beta-N-acetylmuramidase)
VVDANLKFGNLAAGIYTYVLTAEAVSYYIDSNGQFATSKQTVVLNTQQCVVTDWRNPNENLAFGIDVSSWQGAIDWSKAKNDIDFAILHISDSLELDDRFLEYATNCENLDIPYGVYCFSYALSVSEAIEEAEFVIDTLKAHGYNPELPIWYDMEWKTQGNLSTSLKEQILTAFCDTIAEAGYQPGFYGFTGWFSSAYQKGYLSSIPVWIPQIDDFSSNGTATYDGGTWLWQYSWEGSISGISGDVDCNICYFEYPGLNSDRSYLSQCTYYPSNLDVTVSAAVNLHEFPSSDYSALDNLPAGTKLHVTGMYKNTDGNLWYQVETANGTSGYVSADYVTIDSYRYDDLAVISPTMAPTPTCSCFAAWAGPRRRSCPRSCRSWSRILRTRSILRSTRHE